MEGFADALLEEYSDRLDAQGKDYARRICGAARRMDRMIGDLLDFERLATLEPAATRVELGPVVDQVLVEMADELRRTGAEVLVERPLLAAHANTELLQKVVRELVANALRFVPADARPHVIVRTEHEGSTVTLLIEDNGIGIAPEHQEQIFDPFVRLHGHDRHSGTGIGLAIVKRAVHCMGGDVRLESTPQEGTRFRVHLPGA